jgi:hypothetical protein
MTSALACFLTHYLRGNKKSALIVQAQHLSNFLRTRSPVDPRIDRLLLRATSSHFSRVPFVSSHFDLLFLDYRDTRRTLETQAFAAT